MPLETEKEPNQANLKVDHQDGVYQAPDEPSTHNDVVEPPSAPHLMSAESGQQQLALDQPVPAQDLGQSDDMPFGIEFCSGTAGLA